MRIEWTIRKRAGHLRPKLEYTLALEEFEIELAVPMVRIASTIPKPPDAGQHYVWPGTKECGREEPEDVYELSSPSHVARRRREVLMLPMRKENDYPEIEESFRNLRRAYEEALLKAWTNSAFETKGRLDMSSDTKKQIAPEVAAKKFLALVGKAS